MKQPFTTAKQAISNDEAPKLTEKDFAHAQFRVGQKPVKREQFAAAVQEKMGKQRVSIMLDASILAFFKAKAGERGYQTLINQALQQVMNGEQIENTLRRVIREELHIA